ncbi:MAG: tetratricopeptide repeat protein, partial [Actinomycetia bacterium]|nr:tetratricopeptide repeat protein [Actinomycetes bacterium]
IALKIIAARPLGVGFDNYGYLFYSFSTDKYYQIMGASSWAESPHNYYLQIATNIGLIGLLFLILLIILPYKMYLQRRQKPFEKEIVPIVLFSSISGFLLYLFSGLSHISITPLFFLLLSFGASKTLKIKKIRLNIPNSFLKGFLITFVVFSLLFIYFITSLFQAEYFYTKAFFGNSESLDQREEFALKAVKLNRFSDTYQSRLAYFYFSLWQAFKDETYFKNAERHYRKALELNTINIYNYLNYGDFLFKAGTQKDPKHLNEASGIYKKALEIAPGSPIVNTIFGRSLLFIRETEKAFFYLEKAIYLDPNYAEGYYNLALYYLEKNNTKEAIKYFKLAVKNDSKYSKDKLVNEVVYGKK